MSKKIVIKGLASFIKNELLNNDFMDRPIPDRTRIIDRNSGKGKSAQELNEDNHRAIENLSKTLQSMDMDSEEVINGLNKYTIKEHMNFNLDILKKIDDPKCYTTVTDVDGKLIPVKKFFEDMEKGLGDELDPNNKESILEEYINRYIYSVKISGNGSFAFMDTAFDVYSEVSVILGRLSTMAISVSALANNLFKDAKQLSDPESEVGKLLISMDNREALNYFHENKDLLSDEQYELLQKSGKASIASASLSAMSNILIKMNRTFMADEAEKKDLVNLREYFFSKLARDSGFDVFGENVGSTKSREMLISMSTAISLAAINPEAHKDMLAALQDVVYKYSPEHTMRDIIIC